MDVLDKVMVALGETAIKIFARSCRKEIAVASKDDLNAVSAAMRAKVPEVVDQLMDDIREAPHIYNVAFANAALEIAKAGIEELRMRINSDITD